MQGGICGHFSCLQECLEGAVGSSVTVDMRLESALNGGELKCYCGHASLLPSHPLPSLLSPGDVLFLNHYSRSNALQALQYLQCTMCILQCAGCTVITLHFLAGLRCSCVSSSNVMEVAPRERRDLQHSLHGGGSGRGLERNCSKGREKISGGGFVRWVVGGGLRRRQEDAWVRDQEPPARQARDTLVRGSFGFSSPLEGGKWGSE